MRILVVEDEHKIAEALRKGLMQERYAVDLAYDGQDGYEMATTCDYDVIILDLMMPKMDGLTVCKKLRSENVHAPILVLTAKTQTKDKVEGLNSGADDYLAKPFAFEELLARIRALIRRPPTETGTTLSHESLHMNLSTFEVVNGNTQIQLSSKEYALLEYLMRHPKQVLTKEQIVNHVWDYD
ncbi:MAG: response regulator transcription factor, partial [Microgenomates group bacterium]